MIDRRHFVAGAGALAIAPPAQARSEDALKRVDPATGKGRAGVRVIDPKI